MTISPLLRKFVDDELSRIPELIERVRVGAVVHLKHSAPGALVSALDRQEILDGVGGLQAKRKVFNATFCKNLQELVLAEVQEQPSQSFGSASLEDDFAGLTPVDDSRVESDLEVSRTALRITSAADWELRELQSFTSTLCGHAQFTPGANPLRPIFYARALWAAVGEATLTRWTRSTLFEALAKSLAGELRIAWAAATTRLENQGVEPVIYQTAVLPPGGAIERSVLRRTGPFEDETSGALVLSDTEKNAFALPINTGDHFGEWPSLPGKRAQTRLTGVRSSPEPLFQENLLKFENALHDIEMPAVTAKLNSNTNSPRLRDHQTALVGGVTDVLDRQIIDFFSRFFDHVLSDICLHPGLRVILAKLQASVLRLALQDESLMEARTHPAWSLMDIMGEAGASYPQPSDPRLGMVLAFCDDLVRKLVETLIPNTETYNDALVQLKIWLNKLLQQQISEAQPQVGHLARLDRRDSLKLHFSIQLRDQLAAFAISNRFRHFLMDAWAQVLAESVQNYGEHHETTRAYVKVVDELVWSITPANHLNDKARLLQILPWLRQQLTTGMASIYLHKAVQESVLSELEAICPEFADRSPTEMSSGSGAPGANSVVQPTHVYEPAEAIHTLADDVLETYSMDTVPDDLMESSPLGLISDRPQRHRSGADVPVGSKLRIFMRGQWVRVQLLWRSPLGGLLLFAGESAGCTHSVTENALQRLIQEGLVLALEDKSLSDRAMSALQRDID